MEINLTVETLIKILKLYYKKSEDFTGEIEPRTKIVVESHYSDYYDVAKVFFVLKGTLEYLGEQLPYSKEVSGEEAKEAIEDFFASNDLELQDLTYDTKIIDEEHKDNTKKSAEINGVKCIVKNNKKIKIRKQ